MSQARCPECDTLQDINQSPVALKYRDGYPVGTSRYWTVAPHPDERLEPDDEGRRALCVGSGKKL